MTLANWKKGALAAMSGVALLGSAKAASAADCVTSDGKTVIVTGSSASKPIWGPIATAAGSSLHIIYVSGESCAGLLSLQTPTAANNADTTGAIDYTADATGKTTCHLAAGWTPDIGASDVYPATCSDVVSLDTDKEDLLGPIQAMNFVAPAGSSQSAIAAQDAYDIYKYLGSSCSVTPWTDPAYIFTRIDKSGTRRLLGSAIGFASVADWNETAPTGVTRVFKKSSSAVAGEGIFEAILGVADPTKQNQTIGILSSTFVDGSYTPSGGSKTPVRTAIKILAYQAPGQKAAYLPDASATSFDKLNVRTGVYPLWGPLHLARSKGSANKANVDKLYGYVTGATPLPGGKADGSDFIDLAAASHLVPACAMKVSRSGEVTPKANYTPVSPTKACGCYYELSAQKLLASGTKPVSSYCATCTADTDCKKPGLSHCNYGFCEAS